MPQFVTAPQISYPPASAFARAPWSRRRAAAASRSSRAAPPSTRRRRRVCRAIISFQARSGSSTARSQTTSDDHELVDRGVALEDLVEERQVLGDERRRLQEVLGRRRHGQDLDAVRVDRRRSKPGLRARRERAEHTNNSVVVREPRRVDLAADGHVVVVARRADLHREERAAPVRQRDVAQAQGQEVRPIIRIDAASLELSWALPWPMEKMPLAHECPA